MIQELVEFGKRVSKGRSMAFKEEPFAIDLVINKKGEFVDFNVWPRQTIEAEVITAKKGKARFLLDKCEEVLGVGENVGNKHSLFLEKLEQYKEVSALLPVFLFYKEGNEKGLKKAQDAFANVDKKSRGENITFMVGTERLLQLECVRTAIENHFLDNERKMANGRICSICGKSDSPVLDEPHGMVKMPKGQTAGSALVSYNETAFESYGLKGNLNSSICRACARSYVDGLKHLLSDGHEVSNEKTKKTTFHYNHRINISDTTVVLFWTREEAGDFNPFIVVDVPDASDVKRLFESIWSGKKEISTIVDTNMFYSLTASSAAARIAIRDWTAISLEEYKKNLADWFCDIEIESNKSDTYCSLSQLVKATQRDPKPGEKPKSDLNSKARIGTILWNAAIRGRKYKIPQESLEYTLNRIWKGDKFGVERASLIKLIINRNSNSNMKATLDETNTSVAYLCGRLFAVIESMQWKAMGKVNSSVKDRFFSAAASQPAYVFGTLLTKNVPIYQHKIGGYLAKELKELAGKISEQGRIPLRFSTIEQGEFALGYYFQSTHRNGIETEDTTNQK